MAMNGTTEAPLTNYVITGLVDRWIVVGAGTDAAHKVPGGSCWHCGQGIAYCVQIRHTETGEVHEIGTTCAERVGLDAAELKAMLAEIYAEQRYEASAAVRRQRLAEAEAREAAAVAEHGEHGTETRYLSGCYCLPCRQAAPHGTIARFEGTERRDDGHDGCRCLPCVDAAVTAEPQRWQIFEYPALVRLSDGHVVADARRVSTRYGARWRSDSEDVWLPVGPKRRSTLANKGYVSAMVPMLMERCGSAGQRSQQWLRSDSPVGSPLVDDWGETIPHPGP